MITVRFGVRVLRSLCKEISDRATKIVQEAENNITKYLKNSTKEEMTRAEAEEVYKKLLNKANDVLAKMKSQLETMVNGTVAQNVCFIALLEKQHYDDLC